MHKTKMKRRSRKMSIAATATATAALALTGAAIAYKVSKKSCPKQGFVFTPAIDEKRHDKCLLIIDPQKDFISSGGLKVPNAQQDMEKLSAFIEKKTMLLDSICITLDTHSLFHIGNANAYTDITTKTTATGMVKYDSTKHKSKQNIDSHIKQYADKLYRDGKSHFLWPLHCRIGTDGHSIDEGLDKTIMKWSDATSTEARYILKGCDSKYENFSAFRSAGIEHNDYHNPAKEAYRFNEDLAKYLYQFKTVYIAGEARTHCVADSTIDYVNWVKKIGNPNKQEVVVLWDCMSDVVRNVDGVNIFEKDRINFQQFIKTNVDFVRMTNSTDV